MKWLSVDSKYSLILIYLSEKKDLEYLKLLTFEKS